MDFPKTPYTQSDGLRYESKARRTSGSPDEADERRGLLEDSRRPSDTVEDLAPNPRDSYPLTIHELLRTPTTPYVKSRGTTGTTGTTSTTATTALFSATVSTTSSGDTKAKYRDGKLRDIKYVPYVEKAMTVWPPERSGLDRPAPDAMEISPDGAMDRVGDRMQPRPEPQPSDDEISDFMDSWALTMNSQVRQGSKLDHERFQLALGTGTSRRMYVARAIGDDATELREHAQRRLEVLIKVNSVTLTPGDPPPPWVMSDPLLQAFTARARMAELVDLEFPGLDAPRRREKIDSAVQAEMNPDVARWAARFALLGEGTARVRAWTFHEDDKLRIGPLAHALLLRGEVLRSMSLTGEALSPAVALELAHSIACRLERNGITTAGHLPEAPEEREALFRPTLEDYRHILHTLHAVRGVDGASNLAAICDDWEEAHVEAGSERDEIRSNPVHMALSLRGVIDDVLHQRELAGGPPSSPDEVDRIARKCEAPVNGTPPGYGIHSGAELRDVIKSMIDSEHVRAGLIEMLDQVRRGVIPAIGLYLFQDVLTPPGAIQPDMYDPGIWLLATIHTLGSVVISLDLFPQSAESELRPAPLKDEKRSRAINGALEGVIDTGARLVPARPAVRLGVRLCGLLSSLFTRHAGSVAVSAGGRVPRCLNDDALNDRDREAVQSAKTCRSLPARLWKWWNALEPVRQHRPLRTLLWPATHLPMSAVSIPAGSSPGLHTLAGSLEIAARTGEAVLGAIDDHKRETAVDRDRVLQLPTEEARAAHWGQDPLNDRKRS